MRLCMRLKGKILTNAFPSVSLSLSMYELGVLRALRTLLNGTFVQTLALPTQCLTPLPTTSAKFLGSLLELLGCL